MDTPSGYIIDPNSPNLVNVPPGYTADSPAPPGYIPDSAPRHTFSAGSVDFTGGDVKPQLATTAQLSPDQMRQYGQELQATPLDANNPAMTAAQQQQNQQLTNQGRGQMSSALIEMLHPSGQVMAGTENALAPLVSVFSPQMGQNMQASAAALQDVRGANNAGGTIGGLVGNLPVMANPLVAGTIAGGEAYHNIQQQKAAGADISGGAEIGDVAGQAVLNGAMSYLFGQNVTGGAAKAIETQLAKQVPDLIAKYGAKAATGAAINVAQGLASNLITQKTVNPNQDITEGVGRNALLGAGTEAGLTGLHDLKSAFTPAEQAAPSPQATPAASPEVTQAETPPQNTEAASDEHPAVQAQQELMDLRGQLQRGELQGDEKAAAEQKVDSLAAEVQGHIGDDEDLYDKVAAVQETPKATGPEADIDQMTAETQKALDEDQETIKKNRTLIDSLKGNPPAETPEETPVAAEPPKKSVFAGVLSDESGGAKVPEAVSKFGERVVKPAAESTLTAATDTAKAVNRLLGTGIEDEPAKAASKELRARMGSQDLDRVRTEEAFRPAREKMQVADDATKTQFVDDLESGKSFNDPDLQKLADTNRSLNQGSETRAKALGIDTSKWDSDWAGRMAEFPQDQTPGGKSSIGGSEQYLKPQTYDTYSEFKKAVEDAGGKMRYDNPVDTLLAKQAEVNQSLHAREMLQGGLDSGTVEKLAAGDPIPPGKAVLSDRLARKMVSNQMWVDPDTGKPAMRPAPRLIADKGYADKLNQFIEPGVGRTLPIWDKIVQMKRASVASNFALSAWHVPVETMGNAYMAVGQALDNALHGEFDLAGKNLKRALPQEQYRFGRAIRDQAKNAASDPALQPIVDAGAKAGQRFGGRSILNPTAWEHAQKAFDEGDPISGTARVLQATGQEISKPIMEKFVPNMKAGAMGMYAETLLRRGLTGDALHEALLKAGDNVDNVLGQVVRENQFQHKVVSDLLDGVFSAPKFTEGALRYGGSLARDTAQAFSDTVHGKRPTLTPAMFTAAGYAVTTAALGSAIQAAYTTATTGKPILPSSLKDMFYPRTGRKNADGTAERISLPDPMSFFKSAITEGPGKAIGNRVAPLWRSMMDVVNNSNYRNVQVREGSAANQIEQSAKHIGKALIPFSAQNAVERNPAQAGKTFDIRALGLAGVRTAPSSVTHSAAENLLYSMTPQEPRTQEQASRADIRNQLSNEVRNRTPGVGTDMRNSLLNQSITPADASKIIKGAGKPTEFIDRLRASNIGPDDMMKVWGAATDDEKKQIAWVVRARVAQAKTITPANRNTYLKQITEDLRPKE